MRGQQHGLGRVVLALERSAKAAEALRVLGVRRIRLAVAFGQAQRLLRRVRHLDDCVGDRFLVALADQRRLVAVADANRAVRRDVVLLREVGALVGIDHLSLHVARFLSVALEELLGCRIPAGLEEARELDVLVQLLDVLARQRREAVDAGFGRVEALEVARRQEVGHRQDADEQQRVQRGVGAELGRALAEKGAEALARRRQVGDQREDAEQHVGDDEEAHLLRDRIGR